MKKKIIAIVLSLILVAGIVVFCVIFLPKLTHTHVWSEAYYQDTEDGIRHYRTCESCSEKNYSNHTYDNNEICTICGSSLRYRTDENYAVVISNPNAKGDVIIPLKYDGLPVTSISNEAFKDCDMLTSVTILDNVTNIGDSAFSGCTSLKAINLPNKLKSISKSMFANCISLSSINIPKSVESIGSYAFSKCASLANITIPDNITFVDEYIVLECFATVIYCELEVKPSAWSDRWNPNYLPVVWDCKNNSEDYDGYEYAVINGISYKFKDSMAAVKRQPINLNGSILIPANVTHNAQNCSVISIDECAFKKCEFIKDITISENITNIGEVAFESCNSLESIVVSENNARYMSKDRILYDKENSSLVHVPFAIKGSVYIPDFVTDIPKYSFTYSKGLESITVGENNTSFFSQDGILYNKEKTECRHVPWSIKGDITIPNGITSITSEKFKDRIYLTGVVIPNSVTIIDSYAFNKCTALTSVVIPNSVEKIYQDAFKDCCCLTIYCEAVKQPSGWKDEVYGLNSADWNSSSCPVVWNCKNNDKDTNGYAYAVINGIRYRLKDGNAEVITQPKNTSGDVKIASNVTYKDTNYIVTKIKKEAYYNCVSLTSITIPNTITGIGQRAFFGCTSITSITIPDSVTTVDSDAFKNCPIETATIPAVAGSFIANPKLKTLIITSGEEVKGFGGCASLTSVTLPDGVKTIGGFRECISLASITLPDSVITISDYAFTNCTAFTSIILPDSVTTIGRDAYRGCTSVTSVYISNNVTKIGESAFLNCPIESAKVNGNACIYIKNSNLKFVEITSDLRDGALSDCTALTTVTMSDEITIVRSRSFSGCTALTNVKFSKNLTTIFDRAFENCTSLKSIIIPESVTKIQYNTFHGCTLLEDITISGNVTSIEQNAFQGCSSLKNIYFNGTKRVWSEIKKGNNWNDSTGKYIVHCTDGDLEKSKA